jgi:integrase
MNVEWRGSTASGGHDLRARFCTRLALAGYETRTIITLMGHKDRKTTIRYIRAAQLQRNVRVLSNFGLHFKCCYFWSSIGQLYS